MVRNTTGSSTVGFYKRFDDESTCCTVYRRRLCIFISQVRPNVNKGYCWEWLRLGCGCGLRWLAGGCGLAAQQAAKWGSPLTQAGRARLGRARAGPAWHVPGLLKHICLSLWTAAAVSIDWRLGHAAVTFCHIIVVGGRVFASRLIHRRRCRL